MDPQAPAPNEAPEQTPATPEPVVPQQPQAGGKGYGKRPLWQWVVIYLVVAIVLYGLAYFIFFHKGSSTGGGLNY